MTKMKNEEIKTFALSLLEADTEAQVRKILTDSGFWNDQKSWRLYGDTDGNYSTIGNQQSRPEAALVEKVVNSVDARLLAECRRRGIDPESADAPQSITDAVAAFFEPGNKPAGQGGHLKDWPQERQLTQAKFITIAVTGETRAGGNKASITIADQGEGQTPLRVPDTFLSINRKNKLRIPFVQGKFNMGGTGALKFCGTDNIQLLITKRDPEIVKQGKETDKGAEQWSVTVVRRERPPIGVGQVRSSVYRFLAPVGSGAKPNNGDILSFTANALPLFPEHNEPYKRDVSFGSAIKLYEYDMKGFASQALMKDGLLFRLELLLPGIALPVRVHECRPYRGVVERSFENSMVGLLSRLQTGRGGNLEEGYPTSVQIKVRGEEMVAQIFAFKDDRAKTYAASEGIIFTMNGQTHGWLPRTFFQRRRVKMQRIAESLLVVVDCSALSVGAREDLFMNSRDRLSNGELRKAVEEELEDALGRHPGLRELQERRRSSEISDRLSESKPLEEVLSSILKTSPSLASLFLSGQRLNRPERQQPGTGNGAGGGGADNGSGTFEGRPHPTFFRFHEKPNAFELARNAEIGRRCRIRFDTDVENDYFSREDVRGKYYVEVLDGTLEGIELDHNITLHNGVANWSINLPPDQLSIGGNVTLACTVEDDTLIEPFVNVARLRLTAATKGGNGSGTRTSRKGSGNGAGSESGTGKDSKGPLSSGGIAMPNIIRVHRDDEFWKRYKFDEKDGCHVVEEATTDGKDHAFTFYVNVDNIFLRNDMKGKPDTVRLAEAKFTYGNVLIGLALIHDSRTKAKSPATVNGRSDDAPSIVDEVRSVTRALGPFIVPMIDNLGALTDEQVTGLAMQGDED
ncbi:MAG: hypothetical protein WKF55_00075 [Gemmatimonadaceae bacterium]